MAILGLRIISLILLTGIFRLTKCLLISPQIEEGVVPFGLRLTSTEGRSLIECSLICSLTKNCSAVSYRDTPLKECALFQIGCDRENWIQDSANAVSQYFKDPWNRQVCPSTDLEISSQNSRCKNDQPSFKSCLEALNANNLHPGYYNIQHSCNSHCNCIHCAMHKGKFVISIGHDTEEEVLMSGGEQPGSVSRKLTYDADQDYILKLINTSEYCQQYARARCHHVHFISNLGYAWMTGRNNRRLSYWAGSDPSIGGCACGKSQTCYSTGYTCNCDANLNGFLIDDGYLTEMNDLPITGGYFGDTGSHWEYVHFKAGQLECRTYNDNFIP